MNKKAKNGIKVLTTLLITMAFAMAGITAVLADDTMVKSAGTPTSYEKLLPPSEHPDPNQELPQTMDYYPLGVSGETFDVDLGVFTEQDNTSLPTANDWGWNGADGNPAGSAYHPGASAYDTNTLDDYLISSCIPTQMFGTYTVDFDYKGVGYCDVYYTWDDPVVDWNPGGWYYMGTFGNAGTWTPSGALPIVTGYDGCNCIYLIFNAYANGVGDDIGIDNVIVTYTFTGMDIDVIELVKPDPGIGHPVAPPEVWIKVANVGTEQYNKTDLHLQIYEEIDYQPEIDNLNDFEADCCDEWPFYALDHDGDGMTWTRTDRRAHSGSYSWRSTPCDRAVYAGNSEDSLYSYWKKVPDWENHVWLNMSLWVQGEITPDQGKFEDYLEIWIQIDYDLDGVNDTNWLLLKKVADTGGEWLYVEQLEEPTQAYDFTGGHQDHWLCKKGSGAPEKWWGGIDLTDGFGYDPFTGMVPMNVVGDNAFRLKFTWKTDPCNQFEGAYIDDVCILSGREQEQPLVYNEYKELMYPLKPGETVTVKFPLVEQYWMPKEDTWYFFEVYSNVPGDVDGAMDNNYTMKWTDKIIPDPWYRDPWNGVNDTIYFGHLMDAYATHIAVDKEFELYIEQCGDVYCIDVPIEITVFNNGTVTEDIPVVLEVAKKLSVSLVEEDWETGDFSANDWGLNIGGNHQGDIVSVVTDFNPGGGDYSAFIGGDERLMYHNHIEGGLFIQNNVPYPAGDFPIWFDFSAMYALEDEGHSDGEVGTAIYDISYDAWSPGFMDSVGNAFLFRWPTVNAVQPSYPYPAGWAPTASAKVTGHNNYAYTTYEKVWNMRPALDYYEDLDYVGDAGFAPGWFVKSDDADCYEDELPLNLGPCLVTDCSPFGGLFVDDVNIYYEAPGDIVYTETKYVTVEPKEYETVEFIWEACEFCDFFVVGFTALEGDCVEQDDVMNETYLFHEIFYDDIERENDYWTTDDNTFVEGGDWSICSDDRCVNEDHVWTVTTDDLEYAPNADEVLQLVNPDSDDGSFDFTEVDNAMLEFELWTQIETDWDFLTLEVSNDSGQNWWLIQAWDNITDYAENEEEWRDVTIDLFNRSIGIDYIQAYTGFSPGSPYGGFYTERWWDLYIGNVQVGLTDMMHFRFHFLSDGAYMFKGPMIDDVKITTSANETIVMDGGVYTKLWEWVETIIFFDDMEDPAESDEKWLLLDGAPTGDKWHRSTHSYLSGTYSWWCADPDPWSNYNKHLAPGYIYFPPFFSWFYVVENITYDQSPMNYRNNMDNKLILTLNLQDKWKGYLTYDLHYNFSDDGDYLAVEISNDGGATWKEILRYTNETNTNCEWVHEDGSPAADPYPRGYHGIKITPWLPGQIMLRFRMISDEIGTDMGVEVDNVRITGAPDCVAPITTCILNPPLPNGNAGWYTSNVQVTLVAQDDREVAATYYSIDGGSWLTYTAPITVSADGEHTVSYYSVDGVGNAEDAKFCSSFKIDKTAPTASLTAPQVGYIYLFGRELMPRILDKSKALIIGGFTATATASDARSGVDYVKFSTGAGTGEDAVSPYEFNLPFYFPFGSDTVSVSVTDVAGNSANDGSAAYVKIF